MPIRPCRAALLAGVLLLALGVSARAEERHPRLAIVPLEGERPVPAMLTDLAAARLAASGRLTLVERAEIEKVLAEQALGAALGAESFPRLGALLKADLLLLLSIDAAAGKGSRLRFRLLRAKDGLKLADGAAPTPESASDFTGFAATIAGRSLRGLASDPVGDGAVPVAVIGFTGENVSRRHDWVADVLAAGIEERLIGRPGLVVLERERLSAVTDEARITSTLPEALRGSALFADGSFRVEEQGGVSVVLIVRRGGEDLGREKITGGLDNLPGLAAAAADWIAARAGSSGRSVPMEPEEEIALLLDEVATRRALGEHDRALRLVEGAHALAPDRLDLQFLLLDVGRQAFLAEMTRRGHRTPEEWEAHYARIVPSAFRRIALAELIVANSLPHELYAGSRHFGWGDPRRSYYVPGVLGLFTLVRLHTGPAQAGPEVEAELARELSRLLVRYREKVRDESDHVLASVLAAAAKTHPLLVPEGEDAVAFAIGVREEAAALMRRIELPEGPTGLRCGDEELRGPRGPEMRAALLLHQEPLIRLTGFLAATRAESDPEKRVELARTGLALLEDDLIGELPSSGRYPWFRRYVEELTTHLPDEAERRTVRSRLLAARPAEPSPDGPPPELRYRLVGGAGFGEGFQSGRLVAEEGILAVVGIRSREDADLLVVLRLDPESLEVVSRRELRLPDRADPGRLVACARADGTVYVAHPGLGIAVVPPESDPRLLGVLEGSPIRSLASAAGAVYALTGGPHVASGLVRVDPTTGASSLLFSSRAAEPSGLLDGRPLRAMCGLPGEKGLLIEAGPRTIPRPEDPAGARARSTFYSFLPESGRVEPIPGLAGIQPHFLGEGGFVTVRRAGARALLANIPFILDLDLESCEPTVLYSIPVVPAVRRIPAAWTGRGWLAPVVRVGEDLVCRDRKRLVILQEGKAKPADLGALVAMDAAGEKLPEIRDAIPIGDGALLLGPDRLYRLMPIR